MNRASFGLRGPSQTARAPTRGAAVVRREPPVPVSGPDGLQPAPAHSAAAVDEELRAWKRQRSFTIPWKQLCLMASICFGIATFVLPKDVNAAVNWLLYGLTAMSFWLWFKGRRARRKA